MEIVSHHSELMHVPHFPLYVNLIATTCLLGIHVIIQYLHLVFHLLFNFALSVNIYLRQYKILELSILFFQRLECNFIASLSLETNKVEGLCIPGLLLCYNRYHPFLCHVLILVVQPLILSLPPLLECQLVLPL